jgi:hypothetical protein
MGVSYRWRYPDFYTENTPFSVFANQYPNAPRVINSARQVTHNISLSAQPNQMMQAVC